MARPKKPPQPAPFSGSRAVIYLRVSADDAKNNKHGIEAQRDYCVEYVERKSYTTVATFQDDGISGTKGPADRPGLKAALAMATKHQCDVIVCYAADRISRDVGLFDTIRKTLVAAKVRLETFKENMDFSNAESMFMGDIFAAFAAEERRRIAARLYGGRRVRAKRDGIGSGGIPWGYRVNEDGTLTVNEEAAETIRVLLDMRKRGKTYQQTADALNVAGSTTPKGSRWTVGHVQGIERNATLYRTGIRRWNGVTASEQWPVIVDEGKK